MNNTVDLLPAVETRNPSPRSIDLNSEILEDAVLRFRPGDKQKSDLDRANPVQVALPECELLESIPTFRKIKGWLTVPEGQLLFSYAKMIEKGVIVEVGSYRGRSTAAICAGTAAGYEVPIFAVEPHETFVGVKGAKFTPDDREEFFKTMIDTKMARHVRLLNLTSKVLCRGWQAPVSMLFLDGDHRYESVLADFDAWLPHLHLGAYVLFADAEDSGPKRVIEKYIAENVLKPIRSEGKIAVFKVVANNRRPGLNEAQTLEPLARQGNLDLETIAYNVYYGAEGKYLYQAIPKCACTTIKTILLELEGLEVDANEWQRHQKDKNKFPGAQGLSPERLQDLFQDRTETFKFVVVRNPYARIASAYKDKIRMDIKPRAQFWRKLVQDSAQRHGITLSKEISFEEFIRVVTAQSVEEMDPHWRPQYFEGRFGIIKFNFIGHVEKLHLDLTYILERLDAPHQLVERATEQHNVAGPATNVWETVSVELVERFRRTFEIDFDTLRYPMRHSSVLFSR